MTGLAGAAPARLLGVDLGGTKTEVAVIDARALPDARAADGALVFETILRERAPTPKEQGYDEIVRATAGLVASVRSRVPGVRDVIGVGMPGGVERRTGLVKNSNTVCLNGRDFRRDLREALASADRSRAPARVVFENDANCFALAEARAGAARSHASGVVFGVILGTGVGGGVVLRGEVHAGAQGIAGEWGHHGVWACRGDARPCYCGKRGCVEAHASGPALTLQYRERTREEASATEIAARRARGDAAARAVIDELLATFGRGLANVIDVLDPDAIVLGGGLSKLDLLYDEGRAAVAREVFNDELVTPILRNELGDSAGVLGACLLGLAKRGDLAGPRFE